MTFLWAGLPSLGEASDAIEHFILQFTESVWIYPGVYAVSTIDGIFPAVPSESVVIAASTAWAQTGAPNLWLIWIAAALGAWSGDQLAYAVGKRIHLRSYRMFRGDKGQAMLDWAEHALEHRGATFIVAARFIPFGRVAVNLTAGSLGYPRRRFMGIAGVAAAIWASYGILLGSTAGSLLEGNLLLSVGIGIAGGMLLGWIVDRVLSAFGVKEPDVGKPNTEDGSADEAAASKAKKPAAKKAAPAKKAAVAKKPPVKKPAPAKKAAPVKKPAAAKR